MTTSRIYWIMATVVFAVSIIMSLFTFMFSGGIFVILQLATVVSGWLLWGIGLIYKLRGN